MAMTQMKTAINCDGLPLQVSVPEQDAVMWVSHFRHTSLCICAAPVTHPRGAERNTNARSRGSDRNNNGYKDRGIT